MQESRQVSDAEFAAMQAADGDHEAIELDDATNKAIDATKGAVTAIMGDEESSEPLAAALLGDASKQAWEEATKAGLPEEEIEAAVESAQVSLRESLETLAKAIDRVELPEITYHVPTNAKDADGKVIIETRTVPAGTYELCTIKTLTGARRRRAMAVLADMGIYTLRVGSDALSYMQGIVQFMTSENAVYLLGYLYRRTDGLVLDDAACAAVGREIDELFTVENVAGVLTRFFSSSAFGQGDGMPGFVSRLASQATRYLNAIVSGR